jgi:Fic family protein
MIEDKCRVFGHMFYIFLKKREVPMRGQQLVKLFRAIELFSRPAGTTIKELQETFGIDRSSANRKIRTMENLGFLVIIQYPLI